MKYASALPLTDHERQRCDDLRARSLRKGIARKQSAPLGNYSRKGTPESRALQQRILGELSTDDER